ncbi:MAG: hypothetical protein LBP69_04390 [Treponema sp.]|jgi:hypothetical protein|nr:hypothetical protein [Treponema sp.]
MNMIISPTDFLYNNVLFFRNPGTGRCYRLAEPSGPYSRAARKGLLASKRVSLASYNESLAACKRTVAEADVDACIEAKISEWAAERQPELTANGG